MAFNQGAGVEPGQRRVFVALLLGAAALAGAAQPVLSQPLRQVVETAVKSNPQVTSTEALKRAAREDVSRARSGYFPSLDVDAGYGRERTDSVVTRAAGQGTVNLDRQDSGVLLTQKIFDGFATRSEVRRQDARLDSASGRLDDTREGVGFRAAEAYIEVLKNRELVRLANENLRVHLSTLDRVQLRVQSGVSQRADLQQVQGRVALARSTVSARAGRLREVEAIYVRIIGSMPGVLTDPQVPSYAFVRGGTIDSEILARAIRESTDVAIRTNPALAVANAEVNVAEASIQAAKAPYMPSFNLELSANRDRNVSGLPGAQNSEAAMVTMRWNLFRGGGDVANERAAAERKFAAVDAAATTRREIEERVAISVHGKATSEERLASLQEHVTYSAEVLQAYAQQFELGRRTLLDVLNAENELFTARSNQTVGRYDDLTAYYAVETAKGTLLKSLGITLAAE